MMMCVCVSGDLHHLWCCSRTVCLVLLHLSVHGEHFAVDWAVVPVWAMYSAVSVMWLATLVQGSVKFSNTFREV